MTSIFKNRYATSALQVSDKKFYALTGGMLLFGFFVNAIEVCFLSDFIVSFAAGHSALFLILYFILLFAGVIINSVSKNAVVCTIGYCMAVLPLGAILAIYVPAYSLYTVRSAFIVTSLLSLVFTLLAVIYPAIFNSLLKLLVIAFFVALIFQLPAVYTGYSAGVWYDWVVVFIFSAYVGMDISFARNRPRTTANAVKSACGLYLDIVYVFIYLLAIFGRRNG